MYWFRVVIMIITLVAVILLMRNLNPDKKPSTSISVTLCPTRVAQVDNAADATHLQQSGSKWIRNSKEELDPIAVEKWFSVLCSISAESTDGGEGFQPVMRLTYITGETQMVLRAPSGEFQVGNIKFTSKDLDDALVAFRTLPEAKPPGTH